MSTSGDLAADLATVIARLEQLGEMRVTFTDPLAGLLWQRVLECDVPRLRVDLQYLEPATLANLDRMQAELEAGAADAG